MSVSRFLISILIKCSFLAQNKLVCPQLLNSSIACILRSKWNKKTSTCQTMHFISGFFQKVFLQRSVLRAFQKSILILISVYRTQSKIVRNFPDSSRKFRKVLESSGRFRKVPDSFGLFTNKHKSISKRSTKTLFYQKKNAHGSFFQCLYHLQLCGQKSIETSDIFLALKACTLHRLENQECGTKLLRENINLSDNTLQQFLLSMLISCPIVCVVSIMTIVVISISRSDLEKFAL